MKNVKATRQSELLNVKIKELKRIAYLGEEFTVSDERYETLSGNNSYKVAFVTLVEEVTEQKKTTKKKVNE